jgi:hypothetical protein
MATNDYENRKCPFKVEAVFKAGKSYWDDIIKDKRLHCIGPECMAWKNAGGPDMINCARMS